MGALLSLPFIGYFLLPSAATYSTSLNVLFFYMTWSTLVLSQDPLTVEIVSTLAVRTLFYLVPSLLFLLFDSVIPSLAVGIKIQGAAGLPTRTGGVARPRGNKKRPEWYAVLGLSVFNICLGVAVQAGVEVLLTKVLGVRSALKVATTLPMPWSIVKDVVRGLLLREVIQYYPHRFILHASNSNFLSTLHNRYFHSITAPYSLTTHYDHPLPYLLLRFLPSYLPSVLFRTHILTHLLLVALISLEESLAFSGYTTLPGIMVGGVARRQDLHSESGGRGNFAPWGLLDWLHGTGIGKDVVEDARDEAEKHRVKERSGRMFDNAARSGREGVKALKGRRKSRRAAS